MIVLGRTAHAAPALTLPPALSQAVLYETLRLLPPIWISTREVVEDVTVDGLFLPKVG